MELPQPSRPYATEGRKTTRDFLSLYNHLSVQHDTRPSSHGEYLKTHNFLQPLEKEDENPMKGNSTIEIDVERPPPQAPPSVEHVLHGGIGTYSISHISCFNPRMPTPEGSSFNLATGVSRNDKNYENSNCSSYTAGSCFTLRKEPSTMKGKTREENLSDLNVAKEAILNTGQWPMDRPSESSSCHQNSFSSRSTSQGPEQKNQNFMEIINSAKGPCAKEEDEAGDFTLTKESTSRRGDPPVKVDGRGSNDQKPNTPRSKHSATEQRRRCKINGRLQMLRELIPHSDQKRDKASFLMEVIEYIQFLQEKVSRYGGSCPIWSSEPTKLLPWRRSPKLAENFADQPRGVNGPVQMFRSDDKNNMITSTVPGKQHNPAQPNINNSIKATSTPIPPQTDISGNFASTRKNNEIMQPAPRVATSGAENAFLPQLQSRQSRECLSEFICTTSKQELAIEGGIINISSMYSQGLLNTLTQALKSSGVDLSQASISVEVDIGNRANHAQNAQRPADKGFDINRDNPALLRERVETSPFKDSTRATKRMRLVKS